MLIFGAILFVLGVLFCITIIGAVVGFPLMFIGGIFMSIGMFTRRRTVITNVVQVASAPQPVPYTPAPPAPAQLRPDVIRQPEPAPALKEAQPSVLPGSGKACPKCASNNALESRFCTECGTQFQT